MSIKIQAFEQDGKQYFPTLLLYKYIKTSSHQRLKEKAFKNGFTLYQTTERGTAICLDDLTKLLNIYVDQPKGVSPVNVQRLITELSKPITDWVNVDWIQESVQSTVPNSKVNVNKIPLSTNKPSLSSSLPWYERWLNELSRFVHAFSRFIRTEQFVFIVLFIGLLIQINHLAHLFVTVAAKASVLTWLSAYLFGAVAELTALLLTVHNGQQRILKIFAGLTFWVNLLYYQVWLNYDGSLQWFTELLVKVTLSGLLAYVIYTYAHLFTLTKNQD